MCKFYILLKVLLYKKYTVSCDFSIQKYEFPSVLSVFFVYSGKLGVMYDSQMTNRSASGGEGFHREIYLLPIGHLGVIYESQLHCYTFFSSHPD
jgi:hypothetical protein